MKPTVPTPRIPKPKVPKVATEPDTAIYAGHRAWYVVGFVSAAILLAASTYFAHKRVLMGWEVDAFRRINSWPDNWQVYFRIASVAKESTIIAASVVVIAFVFRRWRLAWRLAAATVAGYAMTFLLKHFIDRPRPGALLSDVHLRWTDSGAGFPSGHTMIATVILLIFLPYLPKKWRWVVPVGILLMGLSRIYLGLHAPLDIVGGFAVGLFVVSFMRIMPQSLRVFLHLD